MNRKSGASSSIEISDELRCQVIPLVGRHISHFSSVEDHFFTEGEALSTGFEGGGSPNEIAATRMPHSWLKGKRSLIGAVGGVVVIAGAVLLLRSGGHAEDASGTAVAAEAHDQPATMAPAASAPAPAANQPEPNLPAANQPAANQPAANLPVAKQPAANQAEPTQPEPNLPAANQPEPTPPSLPAVATHEPAVIPAPAPTDERLAPSPGQASVGAAAGSPDSAASEACKKAFAQRRAKEVLSKCADAFAADPQSADAPVMLAKTEFDRGRTGAALDWAKKAIAIDADRADAYVFLGGAEQALGHKAAARAAYKRYLQLSPQGQYASDLRAVLTSL